MFWSALVLLSVWSFGQQILPQKGTKEYYSQRSKNQKSAARVLLIGGPILIGTGFLIGDRKESTFDDAAMGAFVGGIGVMACIGSIPLFIASARNANKARAISLNFKIERTGVFKKEYALVTAYPALSFKVSF